MPPVTRIYVDAFNLYYGALKGTPFKWLNLEALCRQLLPSADIQKINYYTAAVKALPNNPGVRFRQETYLRALRTLPTLAIHEGHFLKHRVRALLVNPPPAGPSTVEVWKTEEKGSDVNLAVHLVHDAHLGRFDQAAIVSNDSDLAEAMRIVIHDVGKPVGLISPCIQPGRRPSAQLKQTASFFRAIHNTHLRRSQFTDQLTDQHGSFQKPTEW